METKYILGLSIVLMVAIILILYFTVFNKKKERKSLDNIYSDKAPSEIEETPYDQTELEKDDDDLEDKKTCKTPSEENNYGCRDDSPEGYCRKGNCLPGYKSTHCVGPGCYCTCSSEVEDKKTTKTPSQADMPLKSDLPLSTTNIPSSTDIGASLSTTTSMTTLTSKKDKSLQGMPLTTEVPMTTTEMPLTTEVPMTTTEMPTTTTTTTTLAPTTQTYLQSNQKPNDSSMNINLNCGSCKNNTEISI